MRGTHRTASPFATASRSVTYGELIEAAQALANDLARRGVRHGQRVLTWMPDRIESVLVLLACSRQGFVFCPSPHRNHTIDEVLTLLERTAARRSSISPASAPTAANATLHRTR